MADALNSPKQYCRNDKLDTWKASCLCVTDPSTETAIAAELKHTFSANDTAITIGVQQALFPFTMVKARVDTHGRIGGLIRQELWEKIAITVAGDVDLFDIQGFPKIGMSMAFRL
jgi:voltage-dependent anion channel protein 2